MNDIPTLPGTLPGLLQPGCPVIFTVDHITIRGWLVSRPLGWTSCGIGADDLAMMDDGTDEVCAVHPSRLALDLSRPEGVDRALRWLAARVSAEDGPLQRRLWGLLMGITTHHHAYDFTPALRVYDADPIEALRLACLAAGGAA